jgi:uncharacterized protein YjbI with pentapeptide repeats
MYGNLGGTAAEFPMQLVREANKGAQYGPELSIFRDAVLAEAWRDFSRCVLGGARFSGAQMTTTDLRGANLQGARELTSEQLMQALTDATTILPNGNRGPF